MAVIDPDRPHSPASLPEVTYDVDYRTVRATETGRRRLRPPSRPLDPTSFSILGCVRERSTPAQ